jgi:hypothetical protein
MASAAAAKKPVIFISYSHRDRADVAILLISADFLRSRFILGTEVPTLLQRRHDEGLRIYPILVRGCVWKRITWLKPMQVRTDRGKPLPGGKNGDELLPDIVTEIADIFQPGGG